MGIIVKCPQCNEINAGSRLHCIKCQTSLIGIPREQGESPIPEFVSPPTPPDNHPLDQASEENQAITPGPVPTIPPIAGFWRRYAAWLIDVLILFMTGLLISIPFSSLLFNMGPYGRPIGLLFILPYFGIMNSKIGGGQTIGKRLMRIAVRDLNNEPIGLGRSMVRILILYLPVLFNGWRIPITQNIVIAWLIAILIFGLGGAILYTMVFNRKARQGIHDLILGTYVVHLPGKPAVSFPETPRLHWIVAGAWMGIVAIGTLAMTVIVPSVISKTPLAPVMSLYNVLAEDPRFFTVGVNDNTFHGPNGKTARSLIITVWCKGRPGEDDRKEFVYSIVKKVLENTENIDQYASIQVKLISAYDIGIANARFTTTYARSIEDWREMIHPDAGGTGDF